MNERRNLGKFELSQNIEMRNLDFYKNAMEFSTTEIDEDSSSKLK
jgi:hypothetical protein